MTATEDIETQRSEAAVEKARLEMEAAAEMQSLHSKTEAARLAVEEAQAMLAQAKQDYLVCELAELNAHNHYEMQITPHRALLERTAPTMLKQFLNELRGMQSRLRGRNVVHTALPKYPKEQAEALNARWEQQELIREFHDLLRNTAAEMEVMLTESVDLAEAAQTIVDKRQAISTARVLAQRAGVDLN